MRLVLPIASCAALALAACSEAPAPKADYSDTKVSPATIATIAPTVSSRFDAAAIEKARASISAEPVVADLLFDESNPIEWHIAVADDGSKRYGLAETICLQLRENGAYDDQVDVRIVDIAQRAALRDAYREYSLGALRCKDGQHLD
jgi:hypothetical protein